MVTCLQVGHEGWYWMLMLAVLCIWAGLTYPPGHHLAFGWSHRVLAGMTGAIQLCSSKLAQACVHAIRKRQQNELKYVSSFPTFCWLHICSLMWLKYSQGVLQPIYCGEWSVRNYVDERKWQSLILYLKPTEDRKVFGHTLSFVYLCVTQHRHLSRYFTFDLQSGQYKGLWLVWEQLVWLP